ncbi:MAG: sigma-54 dependent transcriptional regulator [Gemmatimonadota bacterium]
MLGWISGEDQAHFVASVEAIGAQASVVASPGELFARIRDRSWDATVLSLDHELADEAVVRRIAGLAEAGLVLLTARRPTLDAALLCSRVGAAAVTPSPLSAEALHQALGAIDRSRVVPLEALDASARIVGSSPPMTGVFSAIAAAVGADTTVLVTGESGTGKEVVARTIHEAGRRSSGPFVSVNCAAIPEQLLESELFGHERGAFTGAVGRRTGRFERANGGTLFLDEIGDMSPVLQAKVLRVLEEREVEPVGGSETRPIDVRVIAATHRDLNAAITAGAFREDLYFRLAVLTVHLPPLRDRAGDVELLTHHFLHHFADRHGREVRGITRAAIDRLVGAPWSGNVRELRNVIDRAVLVCSGGVVRSNCLRMDEAAPRRGAVQEQSRPGYPPTTSLADVEADHIRSVLSHVDGHMGQAAEILGIHRNTLTRKVQESGGWSR